MISYYYNSIGGKIVDLIWIMAFMVFDRGVKIGEKIFAPKTKMYRRYKLDCDIDCDKDEIERTRQSGIKKLTQTRELFETQKRIDALNKKRAQYK